MTHDITPNSEKIVTLTVGGGRAELHRVDPALGEYVLSVNGIPQSHVDMTDPANIEFDYLRWIARVTDGWAPAGHPVACTHLGAGALTFARYLGAVRPGSVQTVVECEQQLCEAVVRALPVPDGLRFIYGDARAIAEAIGPDGEWPAMHGPATEGPATQHRAADVMMIDLWSGALIEARVASLEFYDLVSRRVAPDGLVAVNLLDGPGFEYSRGQAATLAALFAEVAIVVDERMLDNTLLGNVIVLATNRPRGFERLDTWLAAEQHAGVIAAADLTRFVADAPVVADARACDSPPPDESHFADYLARPTFML